MKSLKPISTEKLRRLAEKFRRDMDNIDKCPKCGKPRTTMTVTVGDHAPVEITSARCTCGPAT